METWDAIKSRRNVRSYEDRPIPDADLDRILEAGWRSPSSKNQQRWDLVVVTERQRLEALSQVWRGARPRRDLGCDGRALRARRGRRPRAWLDPL